MLLCYVYNVMSLDHVCAPALCVRCVYNPSCIMYMRLHYVYGICIWYMALCAYICPFIVCLCACPCAVCLHVHYVGLYLYAPGLCVYTLHCACAPALCVMPLHCGW